MNTRGMPNLKLLNTQLPASERVRRLRHVFESGIRRIPDVSKPFYHAMAIVQIALLHASEGTNAAYMRVRDSFNLPDCRRVIEDALTSGNQAVLTNNPIKISRDHNTFTIRLPDYIRTPDNVDAIYKESPDWIALVGYVTEFFKLAFNRQDDQDDQTWKVLPSNRESGFLYRAVLMWACGENLQVDMSQWSKYRSIEYAGKAVDVEDIIQNDPTGRLHRMFTKWLKDSFGNSLFHEETILKDADQWYKCRVNQGSIEAYLDELALEAQKVDTTKFTPKELKQFEHRYYPERSNIETALAPYDEAGGFPRQWRK